jgi:hypothetical protein
MNISEFEKQLADAKEHLARVRADNCKTVLETIHAFEAVDSAQRTLAAAKGEEYAALLDIGFVPETAVSEPVLLQTDHVTILTFSAKQKGSDGKYLDAGYGIVEFDLCTITKFGYPNDEALPGHPLRDKGLRAYRVFEIHNSSWTRLITAQNRVAFPKTPDSTGRHFIFTFHDSTFECIARGMQASLSSKPYAEIFEDIKRRVFKR